MVQNQRNAKRLERSEEAVGGVAAFFTEYKFKTRAKARKLQIALRKTGGSDNEAKPLTEVEKKFMGLIEWVSVKGTKS